MSRSRELHHDLESGHNAITLLTIYLLS